jgi:hypothetical protein
MHPEDSHPPHRIHASTPLSLSAAHTLLSTYLALSETSPHLHPDGLLTTAGAQFATSAGPLGGVVLHNLRRVEAGLRGEHLEPEAEEQEDAVAEQLDAGKKLEGGAGEKRKVEAAEEGWQDIEEWQREQGPVVGEIGERSNFVAEGVEEPVVVEHKVVGGKGSGKVDKAARKKAKKERAEKEKREKELVRQKKVKLGD